MGGIDLASIGVQVLSLRPTHPGNKGRIICRSQDQVVGLEALGAIGRMDQLIDGEALFTGRRLVIVGAVLPDLKLAFIGQQDTGYRHHQDDETRQNAGAQVQPEENLSKHAYAKNSMCRVMDYETQMIIILNDQRKFRC